MSLAHDYMKAAIERRQRMKMAGLQRLAIERRAPTPAPVAVKPPPPNQVPDELMNARTYVRKYPLVTEIMKQVAYNTGVSVADILSERRTNEIIFARHAVFWLTRETTPLSLLQIGSLTGKRDHTTVLNGIHKTAQRIAMGHPIAEMCLRLRDELSGPSPAPYWGA